MLQKEETDMKKLIFAICLATTPAAAQVIMEMPSSEQPDRSDRNNDQERARRHEDRSPDFRDEDRRDRDHSDDEPDVTLAQYHLQQPHPMKICPAGQTWQNGCIAWGPKAQGQLFGPCVKSGWSCKRSPEQTQ
jgi:hypothetical protein